MIRRLPDSLLARALLASVLVHAVVLAVRLAPGQPPGVMQNDLPLEVVLVNARSAEAPDQPVVLAQANLAGSGDKADARAATPLPALRDERDGALLEQMRRRAERLESERRQLLLQRDARFSLPTPRLREETRSPTGQGADAAASEAAIARLEAEIARDQSLYAKRPRRAQITATSAREVSYARYYDDVRQRVERWGTEHFPREGGQPLYGSLVVVINIDRQGRLGYLRDGYRVDGVELRVSSGVPALDRQALAIVRSAAPFAPFTPEMRAHYDILEIISTFHFTRAGLNATFETH